MSRSPLDKNAIVVGKPLPFSIYGADNTLLLAQGELVKTEGARSALLRGGAYCKRRDGGEGTGGSYAVAAAREESGQELVTPLDRYLREYAPTLSKPRSNLRMSREDGSESYPTRIIGMYERNGLILAAPVRPDKTLVPVFDRQSWLFRTLYHTTAVRFQTLILKTAFEPFPHLYIEVPRAIERKMIRGAPRVPVCLRTSIIEPVETAGVIMDLSSGGARVAVDGGVHLEAQQRVRFTVNIIVHNRSMALELAGTVLPREASEERVADVAFHRIQFEPMNELTELALEAYLNSLLAIDADCFWRLVAQGSKQEMS